MIAFSFSRNRAKLKKLLGIRARLALLALILVAPLMLERARSLEDARSKQIALAHAEFSRFVQHSAEGQREIISSVETALKWAAHIQASNEANGRNCETIRSSPPVHLLRIRNLMIADQDGRVECATRDALVGLDLSGLALFTQARQTRDLAFGKFQLARSDREPIMIGAYPVAAIDPKSQTVIVASVNLSWMSKILNDLGDRPGMFAVLVDSMGTVLAAPAAQAAMIGQPLDRVPALSAITPKAIGPDQAAGSFSITEADGSRRSVRFARIAGTQSRLIVNIDEDKVTGDINAEIRTAYLQLGIVCLFVLLGALIAAEMLIISPIDTLASIAKRLGHGDWSVRALRSRLPAEFVPLARAFDTMAARLAERERDLIATNDRLTVMASIDMLSGLANRRGFQSRLDFEWMKALQHKSELSLLMIDVDHFKLYNDTYGHPEGDACLTRIGETLAGIAADTMGFAGRYGGEEFCLLLPNTSPQKALEIGETVRATVQGLALPHITSSYGRVTVSVGVAATLPNDAQTPGDLIEAADAALYAAKHRGRNTVVEHGFAKLVDEAGMAMAG